MKLNIYSNENILEYKKLILELNLDVYYQAEFLEMEAEKLNGQLEIFSTKSENNSNIFIYPYIRIPFVEKFSDYCDLISPYGYAGPFCNDFSFFKKSELKFIDYIKTQKVVSEFIRYHFDYNQDLKFSENVLNEKNRTLVIFDLSQSWDHIWKNNISMNNRNYTNKSLEISSSPSSSFIILTIFSLP